MAGRNRFDVDYWCAIYSIQSLHTQDVLFPAYQLHQSQADRVGAVLGPRGKNSN